MNEMLTFVRVVETGSFAAAAQALGLSPSATSKIISRIEDRLRVRLLARTTRRLALTPEGQIYLDRCREILGAIEAAESEISTARGRPSGHIRIKAGTVIGRHQLAPLLPEFLAENPEITIELAITDRQIDPVTENVDLVLRAGALTESTLHTQEIARGYRVLCASPAYLARYGVPRVPEDLFDHNCLALSHQTHLARWPFHGPDGVKSLKVSGNITVDHPDVLLDLALAGQGIVRLGNALVAAPVAAGRLVALLADCHASEPFPIWAVTPPGRFRVHRVRALLEFLSARLGR